MNLELLSEDVQDFIHDFPMNQLHALVLKGSPFKEVSVQDLAIQIESLNILKKKVPLFSARGFLFPRKLNIEQTSSEETAIYKQKLIGKIASFVDCTGGFGVDTFFISQNAQYPIYCELNKHLANLVQHNFKQLEANIKIHNGDGIEFVKNSKEPFDVIYLDPSRRAKTGKVISLGQSQPNILNHWDMLLSKANRVVVKLSPMLDIQYLIRELRSIKEIHVISVKNDVKEILLVASSARKEVESIQFVSVELRKGSEVVYTRANNEFIEFPNISEGKDYSFIYEPLGCLLKSNSHDKYAREYHLEKLGSKSNFFLSENKLDLPFMKIFQIEQKVSFKRKEILSFLPSKKVNVVTRNFPLKPKEVLNKLKFKQGGEKYLLCSSDSEKNLVCFIAKRL